MKANPFSEYLEVSHLVQTMAKDFGFTGNIKEIRKAIEKVLDYRYEKGKEKKPVDQRNLEQMALEQIKLVRDTFNNNKKEV